MLTFFNKDAMETCLKGRTLKVKGLLRGVQVPYQFSCVHELVDPLNWDLALYEEDDEHGQNVERDPQEVEERQRHERRVRVKNVVRVAQHVSGEWSLQFN